MKKKKIIIISCICLILAIFMLKGCKSSKAVQYKTEMPRKATLVEQVEASGTINPVTQTSVGTQVSGRVEKLYVDYNSLVKKGQLLAVIDPSTYESNVKQQEANLQKVQSVSDNAKRNLERYKKLYSQDLIAKSELDDAQTNYLSAYAQVVQAQASLDKAKIDLDYTKIISPVDGIIISKEVEQGQTVAASFQTPTLFLVAENLKKMQIEVNISEADISKIKEDQEVEFSVDAYPTTTFKATVKQVRNSATTISNVVTYTVVVAFDNDEMKLKPGMTANVSIISAKCEDCLTVSNQALRFVPPSSAKIEGENQKFYKNQGLWVEGKAGLKRIEVKTGITDGTRTQIISNEINENTPILLSSNDAGNKNAGQKRRMGPPGF